MKVRNKLNNAKTSFLVARMITAMADFIGFCLLAVYALILGPLLALRGPLVLAKLYAYFWVLLPKGALTPCLRGMIDWRLGNFEGAISQIEGVVGLLGNHISRTNPRQRLTRIVAEDLYTILTRAYLHAGHIDEAMLVIMRVKRVLSVDRLSDLPDLDVKTAHLVRAGLAAGKLLDGDGVATMFVKSTPEREETPPVQGRSKQKSEESERLFGKDAPPKSPSKPLQGKVIPFPGSLEENPNPT